MSTEAPDRATLTELNATLRRVIDHTRTTQAPKATLAEVADALARVEALLAPHAHPGPYAQSGLNLNELSVPDFTLDPADFFPYSPVIGPLSPIAPPITFRVENGEVHGEGTLGAVYNGPPTSVHGGVVAMMLDELLGCAAVVSERGGYTATLTIRYLVPTPVGEPLSLHAAVTRVDGRKTWAEGGIWAGGVKTAEAQGLFIQASSRTPRHSSA